MRINGSHACSNKNWTLYLVTFSIVLCQDVEVACSRVVWPLPGGYTLGLDSYCTVLVLLLSPYQGICTGCIGAWVAIILWLWECICYGLLCNLDQFKTVWETSDVVQLALDPKTLGCRNHNSILVVRLLETLPSFYNLRTKHNMEMRFTSIDFYCRGAEGLKSSWLHTFGNQLIGRSPYIRYANHKCYLLYYFTLNYL